MDEPIAAGDSGGSGTAVATGGSPTPTPSPESAPSSATTATGGATDPNKGPIPYERFEEINRKYAALKWAESHDPEKIRRQSDYFRWLDTDPEGAFRYLGDYLQRAGALKPRQPRSQNGNGDGRPQPDIVVPETGQRFYSAEAAEKLAEWHAKQATGPIEQRLNSFEADRQRSKAEAEASRVLAEAETWPHYKEHESAILAEMEKDHRLSLEGAYRRVVMPKIRDLERQAVLTEIKAKSGATTASPSASGASSSVPTSKMSWSDLLRREMAKRSN